ncbi:MAG: circadian clock KaiB family protein [Pirellulaceae bacterium]
MSSSKRQQQPRVPVRMTLFVADGEANSLRAKQNLARFCEEELDSNYELKVVDVLQDFQAAVDHHVMVTPTLIVTEPAPGVAILGDLRDTDRLRAALGLE